MHFDATTSKSRQSEHQSEEKRMFSKATKLDRFIAKRKLHWPCEARRKRSHFASDKIIKPRSLFQAPR